MPDAAGGTPPAAPSNGTKQPYLGNWRWRRALIFIALAWNSHITFFLLNRYGDKLSGGEIVTIVLAILGLTAAIIGSYVFGAVWDDHSIRKFQQ